VITVGCCVGAQWKLAAFVLPWLGGRPLLAAYNQTSIVTAYNQILDAVDPHGAELTHPLLLVHDDLEVIDPDWADKVTTAFEDDTVGLVGVAGGGGASLYWWDHDPIGHQRTDVRLIDFGLRAGEVELIEGSFMAFSPWVAKRLRFDTLFADCDFHGYDEIAAQVRAAGKRVVVIDLDTHHHNPEGYRSESSAAAKIRADQQYRRKWRAA